MQEIKTELLELLRRDDLLRSALLVAKIQDGAFDPEKYIEQVLELAARIWHRTPKVKYDPIIKAENINFTLFKELGIEGRSERYKRVIDDPSRYYLHQVLDGRIGCPLTLTILYLVMGEQVGLPCECVALPNYYLVKVHDVASEFYIDPFEGGKFLNQEEYQRKFRLALQKSRMVSTNLFEKMSCYQLVARVVQQLKVAYILKGNALLALRAVELLSSLFPQSPEVSRDRGILYCEMEYFSKAKEDLRYYLQHRPQADDVSEIKKLTSMLRGYQEIMN